MSLTMKEALLRRAQDLTEIGFDIADVTREKRNIRRAIRTLTNDRDQTLRALNQKTGGVVEECRKPFAVKMAGEIDRIDRRIDTFRGQLRALSEDPGVLLSILEGAA